MRTENLTPHIGSMIHGVDLSRPLDDNLRDRIRQTLYERQVIFFRDQNLTARRQLDLANVFGMPVASPHPKFGCVDQLPEVSRVINDERNAPDINVWHSDVSYHAEPATTCVLHAIEVPESGGDTLWSSMLRAYDTLSEPMRAFLAPLKAYHRLQLDGYPIDLVKQAVGQPISAIHPVVRRIPELDRKSLFVNRVYTHRIEGLRPCESSGLLGALCEHAESPDHQVRFRWSKGAVAIWDNRSTQHFAVADYFPQRRVMHRVAVQGAPVIAAG